MSSFALARLARVTGDYEVAYSALFQRLVESGRVPVTTKDIRAAERAVISSRFSSAGGYRSAVARARLALARGVIADELRRARIKATMRASRPWPKTSPTTSRATGARLLDRSKRRRRPGG